MSAIQALSCPEGAALLIKTLRLVTNRPAGTTKPPQQNRVPEVISVETTTLGMTFRGIESQNEFGNRDHSVYGVSIA